MLNWEKKQEELFSLYFVEKENTINIKTVIDSIQDVYQVWQKLYVLLIKNLTYFDIYSSIDQVKIIEKNNKKYLFIKLSLWNYLIIDLENKKVITDDVFNLFSIDLFKDKFKEREDNIKHFNFEECENVNKIIQYVINNIEILTLNHSVTYQINEGTDVTSISIDFSKLDIVLAFNSFDEINRCNYIFINKELKPWGVSNPTGNNESLLNIGNKVKDINIPKDIFDISYLSIINEYEKNNKTKKKL